MPRTIHLIALLALASAPARADTYPRQAGVDALHYAFRLSLSDESDEIAGEATASIRFLADGVTGVFLDLASAAGGKGMTVSSATRRLRLSLAAPSMAGEEAASWTENIRNTRTLQDGDLVLMDYAPDYGYYVSDIGRVWPVNGKYSDWQRELLGFVLEYHKAVLARIRPGVTPDEIMEEARKAMEPVFARTKFSKPIYEQAARRLVERGGGVFSHTVGMAVHDVATYHGGPLKPGQVFAVDPQLWVREENLYLRYEDTVVVTATGVENFTHFLPRELDDLERIVADKGIVQRLPATPPGAIPASP
jgi:hypothetical protein